MTRPRKLDPPNSRIFHPLPTDHLPWKARYGIELMRICREADMLSRQLGYFVPHIIPSEEEFKAQLKRQNNRSLLYRGELMEDYDE